MCPLERTLLSSKPASAIAAPEHNDRLGRHIPGREALLPGVMARIGSRDAAFRAAFGANIDTASLATWDSAAGSDTTRSGSRCRTGL